MKLNVASALALTGALAGFNAHADTINFATGQDGNGHLRKHGKDAHWIVTEWQQNGTDFPLPRNAVVISKKDDDFGYGAPPWVIRLKKYPSVWIAPDTDYATNGNYTVTYTFDLTGYNLATASFSQFEWTIDDVGSVILNGNTIASLKFGKWSKMHSFSIPVSDLVQGVNTLTMTSTNSDYNYEGVRLSGTLDISR